MGLHLRPLANRPRFVGRKASLILGLVAASLVMSGTLHAEFYNPGGVDNGAQLTELNDLLRDVIRLLALAIGAFLAHAMFTRVRVTL